MVIVGDVKVGEGTLSVRHRRMGDLDEQTIEQFASVIRSEVKAKKLD